MWDAITNFAKTFLPQDKLVNPLPDWSGSNLADPNNLRYAKQNQAQEDAADSYNKGVTAGTIPTPTPYPDFQYNKDIANAPSPISQPQQAKVQSNPPQQENIAQSLLNSFIRPRQEAAAEESPTPGQQLVNSFHTPSHINGVNDGFLDLLNNHILPVTRKYGIPDSLVAAQAGAESGHGKQPANANNYFGLKSHHGGFAAFNTPEDGATYYAQTIQNLVPDYKQKNPISILQSLQNGKSRYEGDNKDPMQYVYDVSHVPEWNAYQGGEPYPTNPWGGN